jgi:Amt family ammonium transporter
MNTPPTHPILSFRRFAWIAAMVLTVCTVLAPLTASAQATPIAPAPVPLFWYLLAAAVAILTAVGLVLIGVAGLARDHAWDAALGAVAAIALATLAYWAVGFALQFGGVGLVYVRPELRGLVWEWSPLSTDWGVGWGVAGLSGWFLAGSEVTAWVYTLFLAHLPWLFVVTLLPVMALRGRAPVLAPLAIALLMGGIVYPLAGNWVQGGGWLSALGRNLNLGHGFIDAGGAGSVFLLAAAFGLVALAVWAPRRAGAAPADLPADYQPLLTVAGSLLVLAGLIGWLWANPLQVTGIGDLGMVRGSVNVILAAVAGVIAPLLYTWFVAGHSHPTLVARGLAAGAVAGLAAAPFISPGAALLAGALAGAATPLLAYVLDALLRLDDATGLVVTAGAPAIIGLLLAGVFADGAAGAGWQMTGGEAFLGVAGQGVSGLFVAAGFQPDFPGQLQAQLIGVAALIIWGVLTGAIICVPLGLLVWGLQHSAHSAAAEAAPEPAVMPSSPRIAEAEPALATPERRRVFPPLPSDPST